MSQTAEAKVLPKFRPADAADLTDGATIFYRGSWGRGPAIEGRVVGSGEEMGEAVWDVILTDGRRHWGYIDQFQIEEVR